MNRIAIAVAFFLISDFGLPTSVHAELIPANRLLTWAGNAGVEGGIPNRTTIYANISPGSGTTKTAEINTAIANCPDGQVVQLAAGTYDNIQQIAFFNKKGVTLRGAGPLATILKMNAAYEGAIVFKSADVKDWPQITPVNWTAGYTKGTTQVTLSSTSGLVAGKVLELDQINDVNGPLAVSMGTDGCPYCSRENGNRSQNQYVKVTNVAGNVVTFTPPLYLDYNPAMTPQAYWFTPTERCGVEDLQMDHTNNGSQHGIRGMGFLNCWVKNVKSIKPVESHIATWQGLRMEVRHCYLFDTKNSASQSYGFLMGYSSACLFEDNITNHVTTAVVSGCTGGNVVIYNYSQDQYFSNNPNWLISAGTQHTVHAHMLLWEGNHYPSITADYIHGSSSHGVVFRNRLEGWELNKGGNTIPFTAQYHCRYHSVVGNILGKAGYHNQYETLSPQTWNDKVIYTLGYWSTAGGPSDPVVWQTLIRKGNYNFFNNAIPASESAGGDVIPNSLYYSSKPAYFGNLSWPPYDPAQPTLNSHQRIPAGYRFVNGVDPPGSGGGPTDPVISVSTSGLDFGFVNFGAQGNQSFNVSNVGGGTLSGTATVPAPFTITSGGTYALTAAQSQQVFVRYTPASQAAFDSGTIILTNSGGAGANVGVQGRSPFGLAFNSTAGTITSPFINDTPNGLVFQTVQTVTIPPSGKASYKFTAPSAGNYKMSAMVNCPDGGSNSFFVNIDAEPDDTTMIWDVPVTTGLQSRDVKWAPSASVKEWALSAGVHELIVRGREPNAKLGAITLASVIPPVNQPPVAGISPDSTGGVGPILVTFTLTSSDVDGTVASGVLNYGDGSATVPITSPGASTTRSHTYAAVGSPITHTATWQVTDDDSATSQVVSSAITIQPPPNQPPVSGISVVPTSGTSPLSVTFTLTGSDPDSGDSVASGFIDFGDGTNETVPTPAASYTRGHVYTGAATYTATYRTTDSHAATSPLASVNVSVGAPPVNQPPAAGISASAPGGPIPLSITFTLTSSDSDGTVASGVFNAGDGSAPVNITSPGASTTRAHAYTVVGNYAATWQTTDDDGATSPIRSVNVNATAPPNQPPTAGLTANTLSGNSPLPVTFTLTSSDADDSVDSGVLDYGDGTTPEIINTPAASIIRQHTFTNVTGSNITRTVTWQTTDEDDDVSPVASVLITISPVVPDPIIQVAPPGTLEFGSVTFGQVGTQSVVVKNKGGGTLTGAATTSAPFSMGTGATYSLGSGVEQIVFIKYTPAAASANNSGTVTFTGGGGYALSVHGTSPDPPPPPTPVIGVLPTSLAFGSVTFGSHSDQTLVVKNNGTGNLTGTATISAPFFVISGGTYTNLTGNQSQNVIVRYQPAGSSATDSGSVVFTGGGGQSVGVTGTSPAPPIVQPPIGSIEDPIRNRTLIQGESLNFAGSGVDPGGNTPLTYLWNFGTGSGISDSTAQNPGSKTFNNTGKFTVTFTVTNSEDVADPNPPTRIVTVVSASTVEVPSIISVH